MKNQLSIQEKLWDLRRDHDYKLEEVAAAVNVVPATISKYENKENKEYNNATLNKLAQFYGVSLDWLICTLLGKLYLSPGLQHALQICNDIQRQNDRQIAPDRKHPPHLAQHSGYWHAVQQHDGHKTAAGSLPQGPLESKQSYDNGKNDAEKNNGHFICSL